MSQLFLMPDYGCWPLWLKNIEGIKENIAPECLPLPATLINDLNLWDAQYQATLSQEYPPNSAFASVVEAQAFIATGRQLAQQLWHVLHASSMAIEALVYVNISDMSEQKYNSESLS